MKELKLFYRGRVITLEVYSVDGRTREIVRHRGSVGILPVEGKYVYLIRQYRYPLDGYIVEIPAGTLEEGESPEECALRELKEETGLIADELHKMFEAYLVPGYGTEKMHFFLAKVKEKGNMETEEDERIEPFRVTLEEALSMVERGEIVDAKTMLALLWYSSHLDQLGDLF